MEPCINAISNNFTLLVNACANFANLMAPAIHICNWWVSIEANGVQLVTLLNYLSREA